MISHDPPQRIIDETRLSIDLDDGTTLPNYFSSQRTIQRKSKKNDIALPSRRSPSYIEITDELKITNGGVRFLLYDNGDNDHRLIILSSVDDLDLLSNSDHWHCDGTFKVWWIRCFSLEKLKIAFSFFAAFSSIIRTILHHPRLSPAKVNHDWFRESCRKCDLTEASYDRCNFLLLSLQTGIVEKNSSQYCLPLIFSKIVYLFIQSLALQQLFLTDHEVRRCLEKLACLSLIPRDFVVSEFKQIRSTCPESINGEYWKWSKDW